MEFDIDYLHFDHHIKLNKDNILEYKILNYYLHFDYYY